MRAWSHTTAGEGKKSFKSFEHKEKLNQWLRQSYAKVEAKPCDFRGKLDFILNHHKIYTGESES